MNLQLSINIEHTCVSCGYDSNFIAHDKTNVNLPIKHKYGTPHFFIDIHIVDGNTI